MSDPVAEPAHAPTTPDAWSDAALAAALFAVDPAGCGGMVVRALPGPVRDQWLSQLDELLPSGAPRRRVPLHIADNRLLGGLDLAATLRAGRPVAERGLLAEADGGVIYLAMAERLEQGVAAKLAATLDGGIVNAERDGMTLRAEARLGVVALDEGIEDDERTPAALRDRLAFHLDLSGIGIHDTVADVPDAGAVTQARRRLSEVQADHEILEALCGTAMNLGIDSLRAPLLALRVARAAAALAERDTIAREDAATAARLVLAPRATVLPAPPEQPDAETQPEDNPPPDEPQEPEPPEDPPDDAQEPEPPDEGGEEDQTPEPEGPLEDQVTEAAQAAIPENLLASLKAGRTGRSRSRSSGRAGALQHSQRRGRPIGTRRGELRAGARLNVVETLRAAAPWQPLRRQEVYGDARRQPGQRILVRPDDFRLTVFKQKSETTTIFLVDASGSSALHRLAEAKGAVELLLADCYVRRDQVALIGFRGKEAELLLPPTRSLVRAKRSLAGLAGGGGTPLAAGIDAAAALADGIQRRGDTPLIVLMTDGRANVARDGTGGRARAEEEAHAAARNLHIAGITTLLVDTSPRPQPRAQQLAERLGAQYLPLPHADASTLSNAVRQQAA